MRIYNITSNEQEPKRSTYDPYSETKFGHIAFSMEDGTVIDADTIDKTAENITLTYEGFRTFHSLSREQFIDFADLLERIWYKEEVDIDIPSWLEDLI